LRSATRQIRVLTGDEHQLVQDGPAAMINREEGDCGGPRNPDKWSIDCTAPHELSSLVEPDVGGFKYEP